MALAVGSAILAAGAYLDGKYQLRRDWKIVRDQKEGERLHTQRVKDGKMSPWYLLEDICRKHSSERAIWSRARIVTYKELYEMSAKYAQWLLEEGIRPGDLVAVYLLNSVEFFAVMFACHCIGASPALINYNLEGRPLQHCLDVCESKVLIVDGDDQCQGRVAGSRNYVESKSTKVFTLDSLFKQQIEMRPMAVPEEKWRKGMKGDFPYCLIYTSGTTGLPKGCAYSLNRMHGAGTYVNLPFGCKPGVDCWYNSMPLYHGTGIISTTTLLLGGIGLAIAPRFSVSGFWPDVTESGATFFIYVGETIRYLLNSPPPPEQLRKHRLRGAYGNGLRPDVWTKFQERFGVPEIAEFFSSSEGMLHLVVWDRGPYLRDCVGHHGLIQRYRMRNTYVPVRIDHETGDDIWRHPKTGFAQRMPYEEGGEILVAVPDHKPWQVYWKNESASGKRFARDVFKKGDLWYRSGDSLRRGADGHWYFLDRLGDTFRWKSENVSTAEVAEVLGRFPGVAEANVYGVSVPNHEGRAGCAAIHLDPTAAAGDSALDYNKLALFAKSELPKYAVPVFLRIVGASSHIHNHKQNKVLLRKEGVDPDLIGTEEKGNKDDAILWLQGDRYVPFERANWESLQMSQARL
ncbi:hypothetical protein PG990_001306 [Apiospora arundinis]